MKRTKKKKLNERTCVKEGWIVGPTAHSRRLLHLTDFTCIHSHGVKFAGCSPRLLIWCAVPQVHCMSMVLLVGWPCTPNSLACMFPKAGGGGGEGGQGSV